MLAWVTDVWNQWALISAAMVLLFANYWMRPRFGLAASLLFACVCYSAIYTWIFVPNRYLGVDVYNQMALRYFSADSLAKMFLFLTPLMVLSKNRWTFRLMGEICAGTFVFVSSAIALVQFVRHGCGNLDCGGLVGNPSLSMGVMVCMLPLCVSSFRQWPVLLLSGAAVFASQSSIALGLYGLFLGTIAARNWNGAYARVGVVGASLGCVLFAGRFALGAELANDSNRFMVWKYMLHSWSQPWNIVQGTGLGTYHVLSILLQHWGSPLTGTRAVAAPMWWDSFHSDFIQMLFECGVTGFVLLFSTYLSALFKLRRERDWSMLISASLYGIYMCVNPALHHAVPALFGAWLFVYALRYENTLKEYV